MREGPVIRMKVIAIRKTEEANLFISYSPAISDSLLQPTLCRGFVALGMDLLRP
jgi:hypothetical protein